jgi:hypothetical protein
VKCPLSRSALRIEIDIRKSEARPRCLGQRSWSIGFRAFDFKIKELKANDLIFEFVFRECIRQHGSGEKGFEAFERSDQEFVFHVERERPRSFPQKWFCFRHRAVSWQVTIYFE